MDLIKTIGVAVYESVWVSNRSTIIGWLLAAAVVASDQVAQAVAGWHSPYAGLVALAVGFIGSALRNRQKIESARAAKEPAAPTIPPAVVLLVGASLLFAGVARAQETAPASPKLGTCITPTLCVTPALTLTPVGISLKDGSLTSGVILGACGRIERNPTGVVNRYGLQGCVAMRSTAEGAKPVVSLLATWTDYLAVGVGYQVGGGSRSFKDTAQLLIGTGASLGLPETVAAAKPAETGCAL
jgi:hypothetical protein